MSTQSQFVRRLWNTEERAAIHNSTFSASTIESAQEDSSDRDFRNLEIETWAPELADRISFTSNESWN